MDHQFGMYRQALTAAVVTTGGAAGSFKNPEGEDLIITRAVLYIKTQSGGAATVDVGIAANGVTTSDTLLDGVSVAAAGVKDNIEDKGTNGKARQIWGAGQFLTVTASATLAGMDAYLYVDYVRAN